MSWHAAFTFRGKPRKADITLTRFEPPTVMVFESTADGLATRTVVECVALSRSRTRISVDTVLTPKSLSARLLMQSAKLAKGRIERKFRKGLASATTELERRLKGA